MNLIYEPTKLIKCTPFFDFNNDQQIAKELFIVLANNTVGTKLACNQVGITDHRVAVINIREPLYFINPEIIKYDIAIPWLSDDLSFPQKVIPTIKYAQILVKADNFQNPILFGANNEDTELQVTHPRIQEACAIQHVIDLLDGITMYDRLNKKQETIISPTKIGRNEIVTLSKEGQNELKIKYKFAQQYVEKGWLIK